MKIYIIIIEDRHTDIAVYPFTDPQKAIDKAKEIAKEYCRSPEDYCEHDYGKESGWLFYAEYSCEGDNVKVVTAKMI